MASASSTAAQPAVAAGTGALANTTVPNSAYVQELDGDDVASTSAVHDRVLERLAAPAFGDLRSRALERWGRGR